MSTINLNVSPYFDDFDESKDYLRVLFRPGFAVQARELTQLQTISQKQTSRLGNHIFKDGSRVNEGNININFNVHTMNLISGSGNVNFPLSGALSGSIEGTIGNFSETIISNQDNTIQARVLRTPTGSIETNKTGNIYFTYITSKQFSDSDEGYIYARSEDNPENTVTYANVYTSVSPATTATVLSGVYYVDGFFSRITEQNVVVSSTTNKPTAAIGFSITSKAISANDDATLFDNARGSTNEGAPGANRLQNAISILIKSTLDQGSDPTFYKQIEIKDGVILGDTEPTPQGLRVSANPQYNGIGDELARRRKDESGSYAVKKFIPKIQEQTYDDSDKFAVSFSKGLAYVNGYRYESFADELIYLNRNATAKKQTNQKVAIKGAPYVEVKNVSSGTLSGMLTTDANGVGAYANKVSLKDSDGHTIGFARSYGYQATNGETNGRVYLHDIKMFQHIRFGASSVYDSDASAYWRGALIAGEQVTANLNGKIQTADVVKLDGSNVADSDWTDINNTANGEARLGGTASYKTTGVLLTNSNAQFQKGAKIGYDITRTPTVSPRIENARQFKFSEVRRIKGSTNDSEGVSFDATTEWTPGTGATLKNVSGKLFGQSQKTYKTLRSGTVPFDNDFEVLYKSPPTISSTDGSLAVTPDFSNTQWSSHFRNGDYKKTRVDDAVEITKELKYGVLKIRNTSDITRTSAVNSSWSAQDRKINLFYPDIYKVYKIVQGSTNNTFGTSTTDPNASFTSIVVNISGGATIPQGSVIVGQSSKTRARVALSNTIATGESTKSGSTGYHVMRSGTGASDKLEVCFEKGSAFTAGESLRVDVPERETAITANITFTSVDTKVEGTDITANYLLDNGQRVDYYGIGSIIRKTGVPAPSNGDILVFYSYFDANPFESFYYSVDSYSGDGFYKVDPRYYGRPIEIKDYDATTGTNLRNVIDFRFRQRLIDGYATTNNPLSFRYRELENTGVSIIPDGSFFTDAEYFTAQNISFVLNNKGRIKTFFGVEDVTNPKDPDIQVDGMLLATIQVPPAVRYPAKEISLFSDQQRGYTMRDIGKLEKRIKNLETSVSLSLLESKALQDNIGTRVKSGFIVDDFSSTTQTPAELTNKNFRASIDTQKNVLRPPSVESNVQLERVNDGTNIDPFFLSQNTPFIVKSYTEDQMLEQTFASSLIRINPYATWTYSGNIELNPTQDFWRDPSWNVVENFFIDRTSFGGGITSVSQTVFDNLTPVTRDIPNSEFNTTETNWTGTVTSTATTTTDNFLWWIGGGTTTTTTTTTVPIGTETTSNFIAQEEEFTSSSDFNVREVRERDDAWIRSQTIEFEGQGFRPNTDLKAIFDGVTVTNNCAQTDFLPLTTTSARTFAANGSLRTDGKGQIRGRFVVPSQTFKTGTKGFILTDLDGSATTEGTVFFTSRGFFEVGDLTSFRATRDAGARLLSSSSTAVAGEATSTTTTTTTPFIWPIGNVWFGDPIAQLFTLPLDPGSDPNNFNPVNNEARVTGSFITSVDIFLGFVDTRANNDHVICEIRSTENGYPGGTILGRARVDVTKANQNLTKPEIATNFRFTNPVFLQEATEYAIVLLSPSDTTSAWTALQGEEDVITGGKIDAQPNVGGYFGSFFKSQNGTSWTAEQNRDLTFKAYRAKFTTAESTITLRDKANFYGQPIGQAASGLAVETFDSSYYIKIHHPNHGMYGPDDTHTVRILGVAGNGNISASADSDLVRFRGESALNGLPVSLINNVSSLANLTSSTTTAKHKVKFATQDSYIIDLREQDSDGAQINTNPVTGGWHKNVKAGRGGGELVVATSNVQFDSIRTNTQPVNFDETSVSQEVKTTTGANLILRSASNLFGYNTDSIYYKSPLVKDTSAVNLPMDKLTDFEHPQVVLGSMNKTASADFEQILKLNTANEFLSPVIRLDAASQMFVYKNNFGQYIDDSELAGFIDSDLAASSSVAQQRQYASFKAGLSSIDETAGYITKDIILEVPATQIRVFLDADMDPASEVILKYKARAVGDNTEFEELEWKTFPRNQIINETNFGKFTSDVSFDQYSLTQDVGFEFEAFKIKIEFVSQNSSFISMIRDLRIIAVV